MPDAPPAEPAPEAEPPGDPPPRPVSLMITRRQREALRALGLSEEDVRGLTPAEAHARLGL